jgi:hypothetical protein
MYMIVNDKSFPTYSDKCVPIVKLNYHTVIFVCKTKIYQPRIFRDERISILCKNTGRFPGGCEQDLLGRPSSTFTRPRPPSPKKTRRPFSGGFHAQQGRLFR